MTFFFHLTSRLERTCERNALAINRTLQHGARPGILPLLRTIYSRTIWHSRPRPPVVGEILPYHRALASARALALVDGRLSRLRLDGLSQRLPAGIHVCLYLKVNNTRKGVRCLYLCYACVPGIFHKKKFSACVGKHGHARLLSFLSTSPSFFKFVVPSTQHHLSCAHFTCTCTKTASQRPSKFTNSIIGQERVRIRAFSLSWRPK